MCPAIHPCPSISSLRQRAAGRKRTALSQSQRSRLPFSGITAKTGSRISQAPSKRCIVKNALCWLYRVRPYRARDPSCRLPSAIGTREGSRLPSLGRQPTVLHQLVKVLSPEGFRHIGLLSYWLVGWRTHIVVPLQPVSMSRLRSQPLRWHPEPGWRYHNMSSPIQRANTKGDQYA